MNELDLISLGAGVQSSTMALMAAAGEITPMPYLAIFSDTQAEPESVYRWLEWLEKELPFPVLRVTAGDLTREALRVRVTKDNRALRYTRSLVPAYIKNPDGSRGIMQRSCTKEFKLDQIRSLALKTLKEQKLARVVQWIGISLDEVHRMKPSKDARISHRWPLVELRYSRHDCLRWMKEHGYPAPPRSACVYCPYHSDAEWRRLRKEEPLEFAKAVAFDRQYREVKATTDNIAGIPYLHNSLVPLDQVDFSTDEDHGQQVMFGNECEGMCGV